MPTDTETAPDETPGESPESSVDEDAQPAQDPATKPSDAVESPRAPEAEATEAESVEAVAPDTGETSGPAEPEATEAESVEAVAPDTGETAGPTEPGATEAPDTAGAEAPAPPPRREPKVVKGPGDVGDLPDDIGAEDFAAAVDRTVVEFKEGDLVEGTVVRVDPDEVLIDIGYKSEGVIPLKELSIRNDVNPSDEVSVGERLEALVLQMEDQEGRLILSKKRAQYERAWGKIETVMREGGTVSGRVIEVVKGGLIVDIGLRGFLPASLVELRRVRDLQPFVGQDLEAKVIELDRNRNNVVLSRRAYLEEEQAEARAAFLDDLQPGEVRKGVVSSVVNFGAFVDLGGMDGLVHVSELSWEHVSHPGEVVTVGDEVMIKVLEIDLDRERISLSVRQTTSDPWETFSEKYKLGDVVEGKVTKTVPFGAFVSVGDGVEGLVHVSEIASHHVESPELELSLGRSVSVKITEIDADRRRISLSIKQASPEWQERATVEPEKKPRRHEFEPADEAGEEDESARQPAFNADASLEAILQELKEKGIGRK